MKNYLKKDWPRHRDLMREGYHESGDNMFTISCATGSFIFIFIAAMSVLGGGA